MNSSRPRRKRTVPSFTRNRTLLANPMTERDFLRTFSEEQRKSGVRGTELQNRMGGAREAFSQIHRRVFKEEWERPFTPHEREMARHFLESRLQVPAQIDPRNTPIAKALAASATKESDVSSEKMLKHVLDAKRRMRRGEAVLTPNFARQILLSTPWESGMVEASLAIYYYRILHAQGIEATPHQLQEAVQWRMGKKTSNRYLEAHSRYVEPPSAEDVHAIRMHIVRQRKSAKKSMWEKRLTESTQRKRAWEENRAAIQAIFGEFLLPPNARRRILNRTMREIMRGSQTALADMRSQVERESLIWAKRRLTEMGYKPAETANILQRLGIGERVMNAQHLGELHLEISTAPKSERRMAVQRIIAKTAKEKHPELELEDLVRDLDRTSHVSYNQMAQLDGLLRRVIIRDVPESVMESAARHLILWRIVTHGSGWPLLRQIETDTRLDRTGFRVGAMLNILREKGLVARHSERWFVEDKRVHGKYITGKKNYRPGLPDRM